MTRKSSQARDPGIMDMVVMLATLVGVLLTGSLMLVDLVYNNPVEYCYTVSGVEIYEQYRGTSSVLLSFEEAPGTTLNVDKTWFRTENGTKVHFMIDLMPWTKGFEDYQSVWPKWAYVVDWCPSSLLPKLHGGR